MIYDRIPYTTDEIAKIFRISKLTVYELIKKGDLPAYRVGKQMRVDAEDLKRYKAKSKVMEELADDSHDYNSNYFMEKTGQSRTLKRPLIISGQNVSLDILAKHIGQTSNTFRPLRSDAGSLDGLISLYRGEADMISCHLIDHESGEYNLPFVRRIFSGHQVLVVHLAAQWTGLYVPKGNPKRIKRWADLTRPGIRIVNREKGSGARVCLDEQLRLLGVPGRDLSGYDQEEYSHLGVAGRVAKGEADVGIGCENAANLVNVEFVPLIRERHDLVMLNTPQNREWIALMLRIIRSEAFKNEVQSILDCDQSDTGDIVYESYV